MRVLVCGGREYNRQNIIWTMLDGLMVNASANRENFVLIEGDCRGADKIVQKWGKDKAKQLKELNSEYDFKHLTFPADWQKYKKGAGPIRNKQMLDEGKPNLVLAYHDDVESSSGTKNMIDQAKKAGVAVYLIARQVN